jgi:hypothetical protein
VPETSTWLMLLAGFAALAYRAIRTQDTAMALRSVGVSPSPAARLAKRS